MKPGSIFFSILALILITGCATTSIKLNVNRPAEINLRDYPQIAMGDIETTFRPRHHAQDLRDAFTVRLLESNYFEAVLDREHLEAIIRENYIAWSGAVNDSLAGPLGQIIGASVLIYGDITRDDYREEVTRRDITRKDKQGNEYQEPEYNRKGDYYLSVSIRVVDALSSQILGLRELATHHSASVSAQEENPPSLDVERLFRQCADGLSDQFIKLVAPYTQWVDAVYELDKKLLPELGWARKMVVNGNTDGALEILAQATQKEDIPAKTRAKAYYDLGLIQTYSWRFAEALANLQEAQRLVPSSKRYASAIRMCQDEQYKAQLYWNQTD